ncbi:MAG: alpha/beta hydrolase [Sphingobacteriaceae bacterium]
MKLKLALLMLFYISSLTSVLAVSIKIKKDVVYPTSVSTDRNVLDIYYPKDITQAKDVLVFIHGGAWDSGKKDIYWWLGRNFANKNVVTVIINYPLSPNAGYEQMATASASALKWVKDSIANYGGNPERIFAMGHSAGGHLSALIDMDPRFFAEQQIANPLRGVILNDGFGLDMNEYLSQADKTDGHNPSFLKTFTENPENWKKGSPLTYFDQIKHPYLILVGGETYPAIQIQSKRLFDRLTEAKKSVQYQVVPKKTHVPMISQMVFGANPLYQQIIDFMKNN